MVVPFAKTAASITLIVAPTDITSIYIEFPTSSEAEANIFPCATSTLAPKASKPFIC